MEDTRRCLFPVAEQNDVSFESELLNSAEILQATDPDSSMEEEGGGRNHKLKLLRDSPAGVAELFPLTFHSTIHVDENGAEVTLGLERISLQTPERRGTQLFQDRSLMDLCTPTPPSITPKQTFVDMWCGNVSADSVLDETYEMPSRSSLQDLISSFLGGAEDSSRWNGCSVWQECPFSADSDSPEHGSASNTLESLRLSNLRMRVISLKTRQTRVHQMRRDLSPFAKSPARTPPFARSRSFTASDHVPTMVHQVPETRHASSWLCTLPENAVSESPILQRYNGGDYPQGVCYDSDPEDFTRRRSPKRPRHNQVDPTDTATACSFLDQDVVIQQFMNQSFTLIYHPSSKGDRAGQGPSCPVAMDAWLERGQILHELIQPKWYFRPKSRKVYRKGSLVNGQAVKSIELLDIARILELPVVDRKVYPFAKPFNTFVIRTVNGDDYCFEAQSTHECGLIVFSLKLSIARFGAMVVTSNPQVYEEFFASIDNCVPGEAPELLDSLDESTDSEEYSL